jgi:hypothetical protein
MHFQVSQGSVARKLFQINGTIFIVSETVPVRQKGLRLQAACLLFMKKHYGFKHFQ